MQENQVQVSPEQSKNLWGQVEKQTETFMQRLGDGIVNKSRKALAKVTHFLEKDTTQLAMMTTVGTLGFYPLAGLMLADYTWKKIAVKKLNADPEEVRPLVAHLTEYVIKQTVQKGAKKFEFLDEFQNTKTYQTMLKILPLVSDLGVKVFGLAGPNFRYDPLIDMNFYVEGNLIATKYAVHILEDVGFAIDQIQNIDIVISILIVLNAIQDPQLKKELLDNFKEVKTENQQDLIDFANNLPKEVKTMPLAIRQFRMIPKEEFKTMHFEEVKQEDKMLKPKGMK